MLEHGSPEARPFISQLELAEVTPWRCECGCATINLQLKEQPEAPVGVNILGDFCFGRGGNLAGIFIFASDGVLTRKFHADREKGVGEIVQPRVNAGA